MPRFRLANLKGTGRFALGLSAITVLGVALGQLDRLVLSAMRPLEDVGYFTLGLTVASGLGRLVQPIFNAVYPRFTNMVAVHADGKIVELYHLASQCMAVIVGAVSAVLIIFSKDVLFLWTGSESSASTVATCMALLVAGTGLNGLMNVPYALQLAHAWTRLTMVVNLVLLVVCIPLCIHAVRAHGIVGAAWILFINNAVYVCVSIPLMHRRLLVGEMKRWYLVDVAPPVITSFSCALVFGAFVGPLERNAVGFATLFAISGVVFGASMVAAPELRRRARDAISR